MRGEYLQERMEDAEILELPPRARRIPDQVILDFNIFGTTSACAENTLLRLWRRASPRNYLRVRGEYLLRLRVIHNLAELPPRARRIRFN